MEIKCTPDELKELLKKETPVVPATDVENNVIDNVGLLFKGIKTN